MQITNLIETQGTPYMTKEQLSKNLGVSKGTIQNRIAEIEKEVAKGRYGKHSIIRDGGIVLINYLVMIDYLNYRKMLKEKNARKTVPPFNAKEVCEEIGWYKHEEVV
jgi:DNA-binding Lrp family transcriptional regulator